MALIPGTRLAVYEVTAQIGEGGMGQVYRATDTKLKRQVAIKILPPAVAADHDRLARFQREAEVLASLNHPNIAGIYGIEETDGSQALIMELVEGEDLSAIIARGPIPVSDVLPLARQIAEALEAAHEQGIIHRDLKPANIKVRTDGTVKVLDFGLAKAMDPPSPEATAGKPGYSMNSPTLTARATQMGMILGTAAYMAPEQAKGKAVDKRADIWAFGVVLYEMLTGQRLFEAEDISETLAAVLTRDLNATVLPSNIPSQLRALMRDCLVRDPKQRLRDIGEARRVLERLIAGAPDEAAAPTAAVGAAAPSRTRERLMWGALVALLAVVATGALVWARRPAPSLPETRLEVATPPTDDLFSFAISPDGRSLVFVATAAGRPSQLWLRPLDQTTPQALAGTEGASYPFWSPDNRSVAFFSGGGTQLKRVDIGSGQLQAVTGTPNAGRGGSWSADGVILFASSSGPLSRVAATGGSPVAATTLAPGQPSHRFPHFLPGGRQFLFYATGVSTGFYLGSLDSPEIKRLAAADTSAEFVSPNWLLFLRQGALVAQHVDLARGEVTGEPVSVADRVSSDSTFAVGAFSASSTGSITYRIGTSSVTQLTWFDRAGKVAGTIGAPDASTLLQPMLSLDGRRVAAYRTVQNNQDLWLFDAARMTRLTFDPGRETYPVWSPDGSRIVFSKEDKAGLLSLYQKSSSGGGQEDLLLASTGGNITPQSWTRDGRFLLYLERNLETAGDLWVLPMDGKQKPSVFVHSKFEERTGQFSPDGRWVAYSSDESGRPEIYVRPFPASSGQWPASAMGGVTPRWRGDGKELYYIAPDGTLMAVSVAATGTVPEMGVPAALFHPRILYGGASTVGINWQYDVAPDGRFLINVTAGDAVTAPITVIQNWQAGIKR